MYQPSIDQGPRKSVGNAEKRLKEPHRPKAAPRKPNLNSSVKGCTQRGDFGRISYGQFAGMTASEQEIFLIDHLSLVKMVARQIYRGLPRSILIDDLYGAGVLGLLDAAAKFDVARHPLFEGYARLRIRGAILDHLRGLDWAPRGLRRDQRAISSAISKLTALLGRFPDEAEIAHELKMDLPTYQKKLCHLSLLEFSSLDEPQNLTLGMSEPEHVPRPSGENPLQKMLRAEQLEHLKNAIKLLAEQERLIITLCYYEELTLKEVSLILGVSESRVSQMRTAAVRSLRRKLISSTPAVKV